MPTTFSHDGLQFRFHDLGDGTPFVFQHGLGASLDQPLEVLAQLDGIRALSMDARAHGGTFPIGPNEKVSLSQSADDLCALLDWLAIDSAIVGGISMGAAVALIFASRYPERTAGLVLVRPAWLDRGSPPNLKPFATIASLIRANGPSLGKKTYLASTEYATLASRFPATADSLAGQFDEPRALDAVIRLETIPRDTPTHDRRELALIDTPTLVLATREDPIHPYEYGESLTRSIRRATLVETTSKNRDARRHLADTCAALSQFIPQAEAAYAWQR